MSSPALLMHAEHLEAVHGVGPHTISVPRIKRADDIDPSTFDNGISDDIFAKLMRAASASAVPYTGMIISTRESQAVREARHSTGHFADQRRFAHVGGRLYRGRYARTDTEQFDVSDQRTLDEVVRWLMENGHIPSFCTACYREGRTGDRFMKPVARADRSYNCCHPNALLTLKEFLLDYASPETRALGEKMIEQELLNIPNPKARETAQKYLAEIAQGNRDFRF